jgi:hypothetical protein
MSDFGDILINTIKGANAEYHAAVEDLGEVVRAVEQSAKKVSPDLVVKMIRHTSRSDGTIFRISVQRGHNGQNVGFYKVASNGYPIEYSATPDFDDFRGVSNVPDKEQLENHFKNEMGNKNSPLVAAMLYLLRE